MKYRNGEKVLLKLRDKNLHNPSTYRKAGKAISDCSNLAYTQPHSWICCLNLDGTTVYTGNRYLIEVVPIRSNFFTIAGLLITRSIILWGYDFNFCTLGNYPLVSTYSCLPAYREQEEDFLQMSCYFWDNIITTWYKFIEMNMQISSKMNVLRWGPISR